MAGEITLTCRLGRFTFDGDPKVILSKAKRIRDEVMGQYFTPKKGVMRIYTEKDIEEFVRNEHHMRDVADVPFEVTITADDDTVLNHLVGD